MHERYWPLALQDAVFKYNLREYSATGNIPINERLGVNHVPKKVFAFRQIESGYRHSAKKSKLEDRDQWVRYVFPVDRKRIMTLTQLGSFRISRLRDFYPYKFERDPNAISKATFTYSKALHKAFKAREWHPVQL